MRLGRTATALAALLASTVGASAQPRPDWGLPPVRTASSRPWLGIIVTDVETAAGADETGAGAPGLSIARVAPSSPAEAAGMLPGDVLLAMDDAVLDSPEALVAVMKARAPGERMRASLLRDGAMMAVPIVLGAQPRGWDEVRRVVSDVAPGSALPERAVDDVLLRFAGNHRRAYLGVETIDLEPGLARYFSVPAGQGVLVDRVEPDSPAAATGLMAGDILLGIGGTRITGGSSVTNALRDLAAGQEIEIDWQRNGTGRKALLRLAERDVPVWTAEVEADEAATTLSQLAAHHRREAQRLTDLLRSLEKGDLEPYLQKAKAGREAETAALQLELSALRQRLAEVESRLAETRRAP